MDTDALIAQMERDDLDGPPKLSPVDYGKLRGIQPQLVYYHIRAGHIQSSRCDCGRKVITVKEADDFFAGKEKEKQDKDKKKEKSGAVEEEQRQSGQQQLRRGQPSTSVTRGDRRKGRPARQ